MNEVFFDANSLEVPDHSKLPTGVFGSVLDKLLSPSILGDKRFATGESESTLSVAITDERSVCRFIKSGYRISVRSSVLLETGVTVAWYFLC